MIIISDVDDVYLNVNHQIWICHFPFLQIHFNMTLITVAHLGGKHLHVSPQDIQVSSVDETHHFHQNY